MQEPIQRYRASSRQIVKAGLPPIEWVWRALMQEEDRLCHIGLWEGMTVNVMEARKRLIEMHQETRSFSETARRSTPISWNRLLSTTS